MIGPKAAWEPDRTGQTGRQDVRRVSQGDDAHHNPPPSEIVQRYKFHTRQRQPGETIAKYVSELRWFAQTCRFGDSPNDDSRPPCLRSEQRSHSASAIVGNRAGLEQSSGVGAGNGDRSKRRAAEPQLQKDVCKV